MGFSTHNAAWLLSESERRQALESVAATAKQAKALVAVLPTNRELLTKVRRYGLQKI
jgi:hypothetical protein